MKNLYAKIAESRIRQYLKTHPVSPFEDDQGVINQSDYAHRLISFFGANEQVWQPIPLRPAPRPMSRWIE